MKLYMMHKNYNTYSILTKIHGNISSKLGTQVYALDLGWALIQGKTGMQRNLDKYANQTTCK